MQRDHDEIVPRGTWNDDNASDDPGAPRHSVNGPYRDAEAGLRAKRDAVARELAAIDRRLAARAEKARELARAERALRAGTQPSWLAAVARNATRALVFAAIGAGVTLALVTDLRSPLVPVADAASVRVLPARYFVSRDRLDDVLAGRSVSVDPVVEKGTVVGLRLSGIGPDEMRDLGLLNGDVVLGVDGFDIADGDGARIAYGIARRARSFELVVRRRGGVRVLRYDVVG